jgi:hypothetical protein
MSCEKEDADHDFKTMAVLDLRTNSNLTPLTLFDFIEEIIAIPGTDPILYDTLGRTEVCFNGDIIFDYSWKHGYMSAISLRTRVMFSSSDNIYVVFIANSDIFFNEIAIINSTGTLLKKADFSTVSIKKVEIDEVSRKLRITINNSWSRTGESSDDVKIINY